MILTCDDRSTVSPRVCHYVHLVTYTHAPFHVYFRRRLVQVVSGLVKDVRSRQEERLRVTAWRTESMAMRKTCACLSERVVYQCTVYRVQCAVRSSHSTAPVF